MAIVWLWCRPGSRRRTRSAGVRSHRRGQPFGGSHRQCTRTARTCSPPALHGWPLPARPRLPLRAQRTASAQARLSRTAGSADPAKLKAFRRPQHSGRRHAEDRLITFVRLTPSKWLMLASLRSSRRGLTRSTVVEAAGPGGKRWNPCPLMTCRDPARGGADPRLLAAAHVINPNCRLGRTRMTYLLTNARNSSPEEVLPYAGSLDCAGIAASTTPRQQSQRRRGSNGEQP
jgi:hypothetical protein